MSADIINRIKSDLVAAFSPTLIHVEDESHLHIGHAGAQSGKGHYALTISAEAFNGKSRIQTHRLIYDALGVLMTEKIHALSIKVTNG